MERVCLHFALNFWRENWNFEFSREITTGENRKNFEILVLCVTIC